MQVSKPVQLLLGFLLLFTVAATVLDYIGNRMNPFPGTPLTNAEYHRWLEKHPTEKGK